MPSSLANPLQTVGTGVQAFGQFQAGSMNAYIANQRALLANQQAQSALRQGAETEGLYRTKANQFIGKQQAAVGASGVQASGSPMRVIEDTAGLEAADIARIRNNAAMDAWGFRSSANADTWNASARKAEGTGGALGTLLIGGSRIKGIWNDDAA